VRGQQRVHRALVETDLLLGPFLVPERCVHGGRLAMMLNGRLGV
jgi:hypothetical protein